MPWISWPERLVSAVAKGDRFSQTRGAKPRPPRSAGEKAIRGGQERRTLKCRTGPPSRRRIDAQRIDLTYQGPVYGAVLANRGESREV